MDENEKKVHSEPLYNKRGEYLGDLDNLPDPGKHPVEVDYDYWHVSNRRLSNDRSI